MSQNDTSTSASNSVNINSSTTTTTSDKDTNNSSSCPFSSLRGSFDEQQQDKSANAGKINKLPSEDHILQSSNSSQSSSSSASPPEEEESNFSINKSISNDSKTETSCTAEDNNGEIPLNAEKTSEIPKFSFSQYRERIGSQGEGDGDSRNSSRPPQTVSVTAATTTSAFMTSSSSNSFTRNPFSSLFTSERSSSSSGTAELAPSPESDTAKPLSTTSTAGSSSSSNAVGSSANTHGFFLPLSANPFAASSSFMTSSSSSIVFGRGLFQKATNGNTGADEVVRNGESSSQTSDAGNTNSVAGGGFVFGQNLSARVVNLNQPTSNGQLPTSSIPEVLSAAQNIPQPVFGSNSNIVQPPPEQANSGEENEKNVLNMNCALYTYDSKASQWVERGKGAVRINDATDGSKKSRIIFRVMGTLRLALNTQIWDGIDLRRLGSDTKKHIRFLGKDVTDEKKMHVYMIKSPSEESAEKLYRTIKSRIPPPPPTTNQVPSAEPTQSEESEAPSSEKTPEESVQAETLSKTEEDERKAEGSKGVKRGIPEDEASSEQSLREDEVAPVDKDEDSNTPPSTKKSHVEKKD